MMTWIKELQAFCRGQGTWDAACNVLEAVDATPPPKRKREDRATPPFVKRRKGSRLPQQSVPPLSQPILRLFAVLNEMANHLLDRALSSRSEGAARTAIDDAETVILGEWPWLLSFQSRLKLQNLSTGELLDLPSGTEISEERKAVIKLAEDESQEGRAEIPLANFFKLSLGYDDDEREVLLQEGSFFGPLETIQSARDTVALELLLQTERPMKWQTECYLFHISKCSAPVSSVRFGVRWLVDALGGAARRNFIGASAETWKNQVLKLLEETAAEDAQAEAEQHLTKSSWSSFMASVKRKDSEREDGPAEQLDYHCSVFCLLT
eukprot:s2009_g18.t1